MASEEDQLVETHKVQNLQVSVTRGNQNETKANTNANENPDQHPRRQCQGGRSLFHNVDSVLTTFEGPLDECLPDTDTDPYTNSPIKPKPHSHPSLTACMYPTIEDALKGLAFKQTDRVPTIRYSSILYYLTACIKKGVEVEDEGYFESHQCYFYTDGSIKFRHEGIGNRMPRKVFLCDRQAEDFADKVWVFFSASGSGKTVELAGSCATRGVDLAIVVTMEDTEANQVQNTKERNERSMELLHTKIKQVLNESPNLKTFVDLATETRPLRITLGIDEASACPKLVRSIIAQPCEAAEEVARALTGETSPTASSGNTIEVSFSVAGTGASTGAVGSNTENYESLEPSARSFIREICDNLLEEKRVDAMLPLETSKSSLRYDRIKDKLPVVETLMQNGRMASIAAKKIMEMAEKKNKKEEQLDEAKLVKTIVESYMKSNGMQHLVGSPSQMAMAAACALAVYLFQWDNDNPGPKTPRTQEEFRTFMSSMKCGVKFCKDVEDEVIEVQTIVSRFGLLEPSLETAKMKPGQKPTKLFRMTASQQLVALTMLGMDMGQPGFECMSTHIVKCAIAASCVVEKKSRPSLQLVLRKIGFQLCQYSTSNKITTKWNALRYYKAAPHYWSLESNHDTAEFHHETKNMKAALDFDYYKGEKYLRICKQAHKILTSMQFSEPSIGSKCFTPGAFINYGSSPFADGFVTFYCDGPFGFITKAKIKYTLMIRANKNDYHGDLASKIVDLNNHAEKHDDGLLDGVFGKEKHRLFCVAASSGRLDLANEKCEQQRDFVPYASDEGKILGKLLPRLSHGNQMNENESQKNSILCDSMGKEMEIE